MKENVEKLKLGKGAYFVKTRLKRLPQTDDVWMVDLQPFHEAGKGRKHRSWLGVVLSRTDDFILADRVLDTPPTINDLARLLADGMRRPLIESAHRPARIVLRDNPLWQEIVPHLKELKIEVVTQEKLPEWDGMLLDFAREQEKQDEAKTKISDQPYRVQPGFQGDRRIGSVRSTLYPRTPVAGILMTDPEKSSGMPRFEPGAKVRVKLGVTDPDFSDIPLGGWSGTVKKIEQAKGEPTYLIEWNKKTLKGIHPVYRKRCERDGLEFEAMWLGEDDIDPDEGKPVPIEKPTSIVTKPLSEKDQDDRVRTALGLTHDDPLPEVSRKTLMAYHRYLTAHFKFPFKARYESDGTSLTVHRLPGPKEYDLDEEEGLLCEARGREGPFDVPLAELDDAVGNRKLVEDYGYWFWNWR